MTTNFFHPSLLLLFLYPGWVKIRIRDKHPGSATLLRIRKIKSLLNKIKKLSYLFHYQRHFVCWHCVLKIYFFGNAYKDKHETLGDLEGSRK
jgi:hypothetical protein